MTAPNATPPLQQVSPDLHRAAHRVLMASFSGPAVPAWVVDRLAAGLGSVCLFGSNLGSDPRGGGDARDDVDPRDDAHVRAVTEPLRATDPHVLIAIDEEGGDVTRFDARRGSRWPGPLALGAVDDTDLTRLLSAGLGARLRSAGIGLDLAPSADVNVDPDNPIIGVRSFGADPGLVARHVAAAVRGLQSSGVAACAKHFPGHGGTREDSHTDLPRLLVDRDLLRRRELEPFRAAVAAGSRAVMTAHIVVPVLDELQPASTSPATARLLREELGFEGVIVTDALDMAGVSVPHGGVPAAAVAALSAGADLLCLGSEFDESGVDAVVTAVLSAVDGGIVTPERLLEAARRVDGLRHAVSTGDVGGGTDGPVDPQGGRRSSVTQAAADAARGALAVTGSIPAMEGAVVVELAVPPTIAAGPVAWDLAGPLSARVGGVTRARCGPDDPLPPLLERADGRPLVVLVRDAHRYPWVADRLGRLAAARPDLVVVETGWPGPDPLPGAAQVWTRGAAAVSLEAAADLLAGRAVQGQSR